MRQPARWPNRDERPGCLALLVYWVQVFLWTMTEIVRQMLRAVSEVFGGDNYFDP